MQVGSLGACPCSCHGGAVEPRGLLSGDTEAVEDPAVETVEPPEPAAADMQPEPEVVPQPEATSQQASIEKAAAERLAAIRGSVNRSS